MVALKHLVLVIPNKLHADGTDVKLLVIGWRLLFGGLIVEFAIERRGVFVLLLVALLRRQQLAPVHQPVFRLEDLTHLLVFYHCNYYLYFLSNFFLLTLTPICPFELRDDYQINNEY